MPYPITKINNNNNKISKQKWLNPVTISSFGRDFWGHPRAKKITQLYYFTFYIAELYNFTFYIPTQIVVNFRYFRKKRIFTDIVKAINLSLKNFSVTAVT
jgi:hypothetical protein